MKRSMNDAQMGAHKAKGFKSEGAYPISISDDTDLAKAPEGWVPHRDPTTYKAEGVPTVRA